MKAVLASYTLSLAVFIPISGWVANRFGTRRVFASAIGVFTLGSFLVRRLDQYPRAGGVPHPAGLRRRHDAARGPAHHGAHLRQIRAHPRHELRRHSRARRPDARAAARRIDHRLFSLERDFLRQHPDRPVRPGPGAQALAELRRRQELSAGLRRAGAVRLGHLAAVLRARGIRRAHAERPRDRRRCWRSRRRCSRPTACIRCARRIRCCASSLTRIRSFRVAVSGNLLTRLGHRRPALPAAAALPGGTGLHARSNPDS